MPLIDITPPSAVSEASGCKLLLPDVFCDARGFFLESYNRDKFAAVGIDDEFVQDNYSRSVHSTLRGLHYQSEPGQAKLVRCTSGAIFDVVVDLRAGSPNYGGWTAFELSAENHRMLYVPVGFAHGFMVTSHDPADVHYKCSEVYNPETERGIAWNDPTLAIVWPTWQRPLLSARDLDNPTFKDFKVKNDVAWVGTDPY